MKQLIVATLLCLIMTACGSEDVETRTVFDLAMHLEAQGYGGAWVETDFETLDAIDGLGIEGGAFSIELYQYASESQAESGEQIALDLSEVFVLSISAYRNEDFVMIASGSFEDLPGLVSAFSEF